MILDEGLFRILNGLAGEVAVLDHLVRLVSGDHLIPILAALTLVWLWFAGRDEVERSLFQRTALSGVAALGLGSLAADLIAALVGRSRPFTVLGGVELLFYPPTDPSFPSHPVTVVVAIGAAVWFGHRGLGTLIVWSGVAMGMARVVAGVFWPSDILAAVALGLAIGAVVPMLLRAIEPFPNRVTRLLLGTPLPARAREPQ